MKNNKLTSNEYQTDFVEQQLIDDNKAPLSNSELLHEGNEHKQKLIKQKALSVVDPLSSVKMLELLKEYNSLFDQAEKNYNYVVGDYSYVALQAGKLKAVRQVIGYYDMTEEQQEKIDNYINS